MPMTPDAKSKLSKVVRGTQSAHNGGLRDKLLRELEAETTRVYRLNIKNIKTAELNEANETKRRRLREWLDEQVRCETGKHKRTADDFLKQAVKQAAYTLLNRIVILKLMEGMGLRSYKVLTGGWNSPGYKDFRSLGAALVRDEADRSEGYAYLLRLIFEELATDMPGLFGSAGIADLIPVPADLLKDVIEAFDDPELESCWSDDMTLGWIYQYWNDPDREAIDAKLNAGGKVEPHEIASKTQMFTERYMVDWLLQNSLGPMWLAMCRKHGWTPDCEAEGTLDALEERRVAWRARRDERQAAVGEAEARQEADPQYTFNEDDLPGVSLTELMPLHNDAERRWAYFVPQPIPDDTVEHASDSVRDLKILDPAVGSGHFLVVAFDLLFALYKEEAKHRGETGGERWKDDVIVERILEHNLHGIDLDPRAVQIAAAALWLKAQTTSPNARPKQMNLVASNLGISSLAENDPGLLELRRTVEDETGIPAELTNKIIEALRGAEYLGSLLKIDAAIGEAITEYEKVRDTSVSQLNLFPDGRIVQTKLPFPRERAERNMLSAIELFLSRHTNADELGLRLRGEQLAAGVLFLRLNRESEYDLVCGNPPYQGTSKLTEAKYVQNNYQLAKSDLYAAFLLRGLQLVRRDGLSALVTMRNWMFIKQYAKLREHLLQTFDLRSLGDFDKGAFESMTTSQLISVCLCVVRNRVPDSTSTVAIQPTALGEKYWSRDRTHLKRAAVLCQRGSYRFSPEGLRVVPEWPLVYWWTAELELYSDYPLLGEVSPARATQGLYNNVRFIRTASEVPHRQLRLSGEKAETTTRWVPLTNGADGAEWIEPLRIVAHWGAAGIEPKVYMSEKTNSVVYRYANEQFFFRPGGVAFASIGSGFSARLSRYTGIFANMGRTVFSDDPSAILALLNSCAAKEIMSGLNPSVHFETGDVNRLPVFPIEDAILVLQRVQAAADAHEATREPSIEFASPGPSPWRHAQEEAQRAVDRPEGEPLPPYEHIYDSEPPTDHASFAVGVALGRFGPNGNGILDPETADLTHALPHGLLFLDGTLDESDLRDGLGHPSAQVIHDTWSIHGADIDANTGLRKWLRTKFFPDVHKGMYENRPIHWPLSSAKKTFVAWINIHRWNDRTLTNLLVILRDTLRRLDGELTDLRQARDGSDAAASRSASSHIDQVKSWHSELEEFINNVQQCAGKGPPSPEVAAGKEQCPPRDCDAAYDPNLNDGVMINSAALWPLLDPQWKDPKKWWQELAWANPKGNKDYDWSHLAMKYWPDRVDAKCQQDPSLGVAHGCFWKYHPAKAWKWELRLQDEIGPDFRIEEAPYRDDGGDPEHRAAYLEAEPAEALEAVEKELIRRRGKGDDIKVVPEMTLLESGLWSALPEKCWDIEAKFIKKQKAPFRLLAPDEAESRAAFVEQNAALARQRNELLNKVSPVDMFAGEDA